MQSERVFTLKRASMLLHKKFSETAQKFSGKTAFKYRTESGWSESSYGDFSKKVKALSHYLANQSLGKNPKIAILMENRPEWPLVFFSVASIGGVAVPIDTESPSEEIKNILADSGSSIIFTSSGNIEKAKEASPLVKKVISVDSHEFTGILKNPVSELPEVEASSSDLACILYTSGTTAEPKGVMLTHENLSSNCESIYTRGIVTEKDSIISVLPLHHAYPLTGSMIFPLIFGGAIIYPGGMRGEVVMEAMKETSPSVFFAVPQIFGAFYQKISEGLKKVPFPLSIFVNFIGNRLYCLRKKTGLNLSRYFFSSIHKRFGKNMRFFVSGGAKLDEKVEEGLFKLGFTVLEGYGLTETSPILTLNPLKKPKMGSAGVAIPGVELKITSEDAEGVGEVTAKGPNIMKGYYKKEEQTRSVIKDGWFYTGDLGYFDEEGYLFLTGRVKEVIVLSSGVNIYPDEVEKAYMEHAPIKEMCVFETPVKREEEKVEVLWAVVVPDLEFFKKYGEVNLHDVIRERMDNVSRTLPSHKRVMGFSIVLEELPRTLLGKVKRFAVKEKYASLAVSEAAPSGKEELSREDELLMETDAGRKIIEFLTKETKAKKGVLPSSLIELDLGIDSLGRIELASGLEGLFGVKIKDEVIGRSFTVRDLIQGIEPLLKEGEKVTVPKEKVPEELKWRELLKAPPNEENLKKIDLKPGLWAWIVAFSFTSVVLLLFKILYGLKVEGRENFPKKGPYMIYVNHTTYFDGPLVAMSLPHYPKLDLFFIGFAPYFTVPIMRNLIKVSRVIPLDFSTHLLEALRSCYYVMKNGKNLCLFPEGLRTLNGDIGRFKKGFGILAKETSSKLVPVLIEGAFEVWPRTRKYPKFFRKIRVRFGKPFSVSEAMEEGRKLGALDPYEAISLGARERLVKMKGEKG